MHMTALIAVYSSSGLAGRCDAKCYEATCTVCECVCGGRNHGMGRQRAIDNTRELAKHWIETYTQEKGLTEFTTELHLECQQITLWSSA